MQYILFIWINSPANQ